MGGATCGGAFYGPASDAYGLALAGATFTQNGCVTPLSAATTCLCLCLSTRTEAHSPRLVHVMLSCPRLSPLPCLVPDRCAHLQSAVGCISSRDVHGKHHAGCCCSGSHTGRRQWCEWLRASGHSTAYSAEQDASAQQHAVACCSPRHCSEVCI